MHKAQQQHLTASWESSSLEPSLKSTEVNQKFQRALKGLSAGCVVTRSVGKSPLLSLEQTPQPAAPDGSEGRVWGRDYRALTPAWCFSSSCFTTPSLRDWSQIQAVKKDGVFSGQPKARAPEGTPSATKLPASLRAVSSQQGWSFLSLTASHVYFFILKHGRSGSVRCLDDVNHNCWVPFL